MSTSELDSRNISISMRKSVENLVISSQDVIGQSISQALTFSGVITQHATQIIQETRNVSRSPSPSLRGGDMPTDGGIDFDKAVDLCVAVPSLGPDGPDAVPLRADSARSLSGREGGGGRTKKKSWYTALYPTYKSKSDDFKRLFKDLPDDERLIVDYSCALQKDILVHGRLYASQRFLCFHASIFGWETSLSLRWKDVTAITKEKTALVIPNAILVCTESEKNFLTSFSGRDKAYLMLFRIWQNALMDQPMSSQDIWQWVHSCYGEELGFNSDEEGYARDGLPLPLTLTLPLHSDTPPEDAVDSSSVEAGGGSGGGGSGGGGGGGGSGRESRDRSQPRHQRDGSPPLMNGECDEGGRGGGETLPTDLSDSSDSETDKPPTGGAGGALCTSAHDGKLLVQQEFPINIDQMFTMIFTNSKFNLELLAARGTSDYVQAGWQSQGGRECRQVSYTLGLASGPIGPKEVQVTETQVMNKCSKPGWLYSIDASSENAGIPYADHFTVEAHYCLTRLAEHATTFAMYGHVKYKKHAWSVVKAFLEKNTMAGLEEFSRLLTSRLAGEADAAAPQRKARRHRRPGNYPLLAATSAPVCVSVRGAAPPPRAPAPPSAPALWLVALVVLLLLVNVLLYWRFSYFTHVHHVIGPEDLHSRMSSTEGGEWSRLLEKHAARRHGELAAWRDALSTTIHHLAQTETALRNLVEMIKPSLEQAQRDADENGSGGGSQPGTEYIGNYGPGTEDPGGRDTGNKNPGNEHTGTDRPVESSSERSERTDENLSKESIKQVKVEL